MDLQTASIYQKINRFTIEMTFHCKTGKLIWNDILSPTLGPINKLLQEFMTNCLLFDGLLQKTPRKSPS